MKESRFSMLIYKNNKKSRITTMTKILYAFSLLSLLLFSSCAQDGKNNDSPSIKTTSIDTYKLSLENYLLVRSRDYSLALDTASMKSDIEKSHSSLGSRFSENEIAKAEEEALKNAYMKSSLPASAMVILFIPSFKNFWNKEQWTQFSQNIITFMISKESTEGLSSLMLLAGTSDDKTIGEEIFKESLEVKGQSFSKDFTTALTIFNSIFSLQKENQSQNQAELVLKCLKGVAESFENAKTDHELKRASHLLSAFDSYVSMKSDPSDELKSLVPMIAANKILVKNIRKSIGSIEEGKVLVEVIEKDQFKRWRLSLAKKDS